MAKFVLIGGGNVGRGNTDYETKVIDEYIVNLCNKKDASFLFIGLASNYSDSYYDTMKLIYKDLGCIPSYLKKKNLINNYDIVKDKILNSDIIYIAGGDTIKLMEKIKEYNLYDLINEACQMDKIIVGNSAGAIMLCNKGYSDSLIIRGESDKYEFINGLGIVDIIISPHYNDLDKKNEFIREINDNKVYGIEDLSALLIDGKNISVIKTNDNTNCYYCYKKDNEYVEEML